VTFTIQLSDAKVGILQPQAQREGVTVEQYVQNIVERIVDSSNGDASILQVDDARFRDAMASSFRENAELYRRLAK
jgi:hypothetical protein